MKTKPWMMLVAMMAGWINRQQQDALSYLKEENKILRDQLLKATGKKRILLNDKQRRRLAILAPKQANTVCFSNLGRAVFFWRSKFLSANGGLKKFQIFASS